MPINGPTTDNREALVDTDFEADAFAHGPLLQPVVKVDATKSVSGSGSTATPLGVELSTDADNEVVRGTDDGLYVPTGANGDFTIDTENIITGPSGSVTVSNGDTITLQGNSGIVVDEVGAGLIQFLIRVGSGTFLTFDNGDLILAEGYLSYQKAEQADAGLGIDITDITDTATAAEANYGPITPVNSTLGYFIDVYSQVNATFETTGSWTHEIEVDLNGAGYTSLIAATHGPFAAGPNTDTWVLSGTLEVDSAVNNYTIDARTRVTCDATASGASTWNSATTTLKVLKRAR